MSLYKNGCSFMTYNFSNDYPMEGLADILKKGPPRNIVGEEDLYSYGFCGHVRGVEENIFHTDKLVAFCVKKFEKVIDKRELKKRLNEYLEREYPKGKCTRDEKDEIEHGLRLEMSVDAPVKAIYVECLMDLEKKRLYIQAGAQSRVSGAVYFIEGELQAQDLRLRHFFSEQMRERYFLFENSQQLFMHWLFQICYGDLRENSPIKIEVGAKLDFKSKATRLSFGGEIGDYAKLYDEITGQKTLQSMALKYMMEDPELGKDEDGRPLESEKCSYEINATRPVIKNLKMRGFYADGTLTHLVDRSNTFDEFLQHYDLLVMYFERWIETIDYAKLLQRLRDGEDE